MTTLNNRKYLKGTRKNLRNNATESEKILWEHLKGSKFEGYKFRRQHSIGRYILDFYCSSLKISIELDGKIHENQKEYDQIRTEYLKSCGIKEIRFTNEEINNNIENILEKLKKYIQKK